MFDVYTCTHLYTRRETLSLLYIGRKGVNIDILVIPKVSSEDWQAVVTCTVHRDENLIASYRKETIELSHIPRQYVHYNWTNASVGSFMFNGAITSHILRMQTIIVHIIYSIVFKKKKKD